MKTVGSILSEVSVRQAERTVHGFLRRGDVAVVGDEYGVDVQRLRVGLGTLEAGALTELAERVRVAEGDLARVSADSLVVSATAIILALLVLIFVLVA